MFKKRGHTVVENMEEADLVQFTGGHDVTPEFYRAAKQRGTNNHLARDIDEIAQYFKATGLRLPMAGICRGGQFLNVCNGGTMLQHKDGHCVSHNIKPTIGLSMSQHPRDVEIDYKETNVTSTHHQIMIPSNSGVILFTADAPEDVEIIWYEDTNCLCFQPHPEYPDHPECTSLYFNLLDEYIYFS
jgi:gamma-glutamyl-gamma-aminobutyrate hydrolase PuuD